MFDFGTLTLLEHGEPFHFIKVRISRTQDLKELELLEC